MLDVAVLYRFVDQVVYLASNEGSPNLGKTIWNAPSGPTCLVQSATDGPPWRLQLTGQN
jgi:hypothetical protein